MRIWCLAIILTVISLPRNVGAFMVKDVRGDCAVELPIGWSYERNLFGLPHVFLSPGKTKKVSVSLTMTGIESIKLPSHELKKNQVEYQKGRKEWAQKRGFTISSFRPYATKLTGQIISHRIGVDYKNINEEHFERSYFFEYPLSLVHLKAVGPKASPHYKEAVTLMESLKCLNSRKLGI